MTAIAAKTSRCILVRFVPGDVQVIDLPFKCVEGDYAPNWGRWRTRDMENVEIPNAGPALPPTIHIRFNAQLHLSLLVFIIRLRGLSKKLRLYMALLMEKTTRDFF